MLCSSKSNFSIVTIEMVWFEIILVSIFLQLMVIKEVRVLVHLSFQQSSDANYASPTSGEAYRDRQLTTNFELWVEIFCVPTCFHVRILKPCLSVCLSVISISVLTPNISNWYIIGKVFTSITPWKPKNVNFHKIKVAKARKIRPWNGTFQGYIYLLIIVVA